MRRILAVLLIALLPSVAAAQVKPSGQFTPGHALKALNSTGTAAGDAGGAAGGPPGTGLTELGITASGLPFCINDAATNAIGGYHQLCLGADSLGGGLISYNAFGGATQHSLNVNINGFTYSLLAGAGNITGPGTTVNGGPVCWNSTTGIAVKDCGNTTFAGTLGVTGATTLSSTLAVTGNTTFVGTLAVSGNATLSSTTDATSPTSAAALKVSGGLALAKAAWIGGNLNVNLNAAAPPSLGIPGTILTGADSASVANVVIGFGAAPGFVGVRANGTNASPTAVLANQSLSGINGGGYAATVYSPAAGTIEIIAAENWTDAHTGTGIQFKTITPLSNAPTLVRMNITKGIQIYGPGGIPPTGSDEGEGTINASVGYYVNGALGFSGTFVASGTCTFVVTGGIITGRTGCS